MLIFQRKSFSHVACDVYITLQPFETGDEIANVNFLYDDIVHALQNTIDLCINFATDRRGYVSEQRV